MVKFVSLINLLISEEIVGKSRRGILKKLYAIILLIPNLFSRKVFFQYYANVIVTNKRENSYTVLYLETAKKRKVCK